MILLPEYSITASSNVKDALTKTFRIARTDNAFIAPLNAAQLLKAIMPADATLLDVNVYSPAGSNAGTSATLSVGVVIPFTSIVASGGTVATVTTPVAHGLVTGDTIVVNGTQIANFEIAIPAAITVTGPTTFTYVIPATTATYTAPGAQQPIAQIGCTSYYMKPLSVLNGTQVTVTVGASPFAYTAPAIGSVIVQGGTVSAITLTHLGGTPVNIGVTAGVIPVVAGDVVTVTYTVAPNITFIPADKSTIGLLPSITQKVGPPAMGWKANNPLDPSGLPMGADVQFFGLYQETGTPSTTGGPWFVTLYYVR
ncbi:MAG: hypothetical protein NVS1B10_08830 [Candidatus Saccharimonadales bacterium]